MTHGHGQHSQTQDSYWAVSIQHWLLLRSQGRKNHCVLRINLDPAHVTRTTKGRNESLQMTWTHTNTFSNFSSTLFLHPIPLYPICLLLHQSVSIVLWMKVPLYVWRAEWCMAWPGTDWVPRPRDPQALHTNSSPTVQSRHTPQHTNKDITSAHRAYQ